MTKFSDRVTQMQSSPIRRLTPFALQAQAEGVKVLYTNIGQPDIFTPPAFDAGVRGYLDSTRSKPVAYGPSEGLLPFRNSYAAYAKRQGIEVSAENVFITFGASEALLFVLMAVCNPGDEVIIPEPFYTNYRTFCDMAGVKVVPVTLEWNAAFGYPGIGAFERAITPRTKAIINCSPNNPTGSVYTRGELQELLEFCRTKGLFLISDEVYREFVYETEPISVLQLPNSDSNAIVIDSLSKRYSACGTRVGMIVTRNTPLLAQILKMAQARLCPATMEQDGAIGLLDNSDAEIVVMRETYRKRIETLADGLETIKGVSCHRPKGAFYMMVRLPVKDTDIFAEYMVSKVRVDGKTLLVAPAKGFYMTEGLGESEVRMAAVMEESALLDAVKVLEVAIKEYNG